VNKIYYIPILGTLKGMRDYKKLDKKKFEVDENIEKLGQLETDEAIALIKKAVIEIDERRAERFEILSGIWFNIMLVGIISLLFFYLSL